MKCGDGVIEDVPGETIVVPFGALMLRIERAPARRARRVCREDDRERDALRNRWRKLHELATRRFQRKYVLVVAARRIRPKRGDGLRAAGFERLVMPEARRAVGFRRNPAFDVPAVHLRILRFEA